MIHLRRRTPRIRAASPALGGWHGPDRTPDPDQVAAWKDTVVATTREQYRPDTRRWVALLPVADRTPAHHRFLFDDAGRLWVSRWSPFQCQLGTDWWVFDPDGRMIATAEMPAGMVVLWIGEDEVIGRVEDEVGVEYLVALEVRAVPSARRPPSRDNGDRQ